MCFEIGWHNLRLMPLKRMITALQKNCVNYSRIRMESNLNTRRSGFKSDQNGHDVPSRSAHAKVPTQWTPRAANVKKNNLARARLRSTDATLPSTAVTHAAPAHAKLS